MSMQRIRSKIIASQKTEKMTRAMAVVSTSKYNKMLSLYHQYQDYGQELQAMAERFFAHCPPLDRWDLGQTLYLDLGPRKLDQDDSDAKDLYIIFSADKGLVGSYNNQLLSFLDRRIQHPSQGRFVALGKVALRYCRSHSFDLAASWQDVPDTPNHVLVGQLMDALSNELKQSNIQSVHLIYQDWQGTFKIQPTCKSLLPLGQGKKDPGQAHRPYLFEPDRLSLYQQFSRMYVEAAVWEGLLKSKLAEHASRMQSMQEASQNAETRVKDLQLDYHHRRQLNITNEMIEVSSASQTLEEEF